MADTFAMTKASEEPITAEYLSALMASVMSARPRDRGNAFAIVHSELNRWLSACIAGDKAILSPCRDPDRFVAQARTYLRALSTYRPVTDAWLDVFRAFRQLVDHNIVRPKVTESAPPPVSRLSRADIETLRSAPGSAASRHLADT